MEDLETRKAVAVEVMEREIYQTRTDITFMDGFHEAIPAYESDIAAAFAMQAKVLEDEETGEAYREYLVHECKPTHGLNESRAYQRQIQRALIKATPMQRCKAALAAVRATKQSNADKSPE